MLPPLAQSYVLQGMRRLVEARAVIHGFNAQSKHAITLAREAELALTLDQASSARPLIEQAREMDAANFYVIAVNGLTHLIDGHMQDAKAVFVTVLQRDPKDAKALFGLGLAEIKLGNVQAWQKNLQGAHEADPGSALILTYLGRAQQQSGQAEAALASWRSAQQVDPQDPAPWLYQAQAELQANHPQQARASLREAQARLAGRSVYRGERLLKEDAQLLQSNLAEVQRQQGLDALAFHTLSDTVGEKSSANLRNQADALQGQRFGESARRSLLLQSMFSDRPGNLPSELDIYGDGAGQTGANVPQHGAIGELGAQQASYNNYDALFIPAATLAADATTGSKNSKGEQVRLGVGSDTLGVSLAQRTYKTDGFAPYQNLDNRLAQGVVQWRPGASTQAFVSYQTFNSRRGEIYQPADPIGFGVNHQYEDRSGLMRVGLRQNLDDHSELRALYSHQQTGQIDNWEWSSDFLSPPNNTIPTLCPINSKAGCTYGTLLNSSAARSGELQYRRSGADYTMQWGAISSRSPLNIPAGWGGAIVTNVAQQVYVNRQQELNPQWQLEAGLAWGENDKLLMLPGGDVSTHLQRWLPRLGLVYAPDDATHVRFAAWKNLDNTAAGNASLAPATLAGIVLNRSGDTYKLVRSVALGADKQLAAAWLLEGQAQRRWVDDPVNAIPQTLSHQRLDDSRLALHWQPGSLDLTLAYDDEKRLRDSTATYSDSVQSQHLRSEQLGLRWLASEQWTLNLGWSHNLLNATQNSTDINFNPILLDVRDRFNQADAGLNWKFNRGGSADVGVRNAGNRNVLYTETDPLTPRFSKGRLSYARIKLLW
jgi:Flp pilus assembly protein TadD